LLTVLPALAVVLSKELNYSGGTVSLNFRVESVRDVIAFVITLLWLYLFFIVTVAAPFWFSNIYGLRLATSYIISVASLAILVLPPSFAKQTPLEQYGFAENWVASGFLLYFDYGSDQILENYKPVLNHVAAVALKAAQSHALESVEISGGIDTAEVVENPPDLAWRRGVSVGQALTALGVPGEYIFARSLAAGHQLVFTPKNTKKPENRFVTITIRAYGAVINAANANGEPETPR
jgi:outer membrane protein OmpA-like peptidoglycan-associated protein